MLITQLQFLYINWCCINIKNLKLCFFLHFARSISVHRQIFQTRSWLLQWHFDQVNTCLDCRSLHKKQLTKLSAKNHGNYYIQSGNYYIQSGNFYIQSGNLYMQSSNFNTQSRNVHYYWALNCSLSCCVGLGLKPIFAIYSGASTKDHLASFFI